MVLRHPVKMKDVCSNQTLPAIFIMKYILIFLLSINCLANEKDKALKLIGEAAYKQTKLDQLTNNTLGYIKQNYISEPVMIGITSIYQIGYKKELRFKSHDRTFIFTNKYIGVTLPFN